MNSVSDQIPERSDVAGLAMSKAKTATHQSGRKQNRKRSKM
jgi:hypothetical protein